MRDVKSGSAVGVAALAAALAATVATLAFTGSDGDTDRASAQDESSDDENADRRTIRVNGEATVEVTPDAATVTLGAQHTGEGAAEALDTVSQRTQVVTDLLQQAGIDGGDIQTSELSVWPQYGDDGEQITGYQASNTVTAKTTDLDGLGRLLDRVAQAAGDQFRLDGISFSFEDPEAVLADVRAEAIANARTKAGQFVAGEDVDIGEIRTIAESGAQPPVPYEMELAEARDGAAAVPIEAGSQELAVDVTVIFELT